MRWALQSDEAQHLDGATRTRDRGVEPPPVAPRTEEPDPPRRRRTGLRARVLTLVVLLLATGFLLATLATRHVLLAQLQDEIALELEQEAEELRRLAVGRNPRTGQPFYDDVAALFDTFLARNVPGEGEAFFTLVEGRPYATSFDPPAKLLAKPEIVRAWSRGDQARSGSVSTDAGEARYLSVPIVAPDGRRGTFVVTIFPRSQESDVHDVVRIMLLVSGAALLGVSIVAWKAAGRVTRPVAQLTRTATSISEADMSARIPVSGNDEVAELSQTFNSMLDRLEVAFRSQREFLDDVAHELRTPITIVRGHLELLEDDRAERMATVALVTDELDRMSRYVTDLLLLARAQEPDFLRLAPVDFSDLADSLLVRVHALADRRWLMSDAPAPGTLVGVADEGRLTQLVMNLAQNAARHTDDGDLIEVGIRGTGSRVELWVRDFGPGVDPAVRDRIFTRFSRGAGSVRDPESTGLGLAIASAIAHAHGGSIDLESEPGAGATFTVTVPLLAPPHTSRTR